MKEIPTKFLPIRPILKDFLYMFCVKSNFDKSNKILLLGSKQFVIVDQFD